MSVHADILLVEDNQINQIVAKQILTKSGYSVETVDNGETALSTLAGQSFRIVLMDVQMPGLDGIETARRIRAGKASITDTEIPIVAMTAYAGEEDYRQCMDAGMNAYVAKPLQLDSFLETIRNNIGPGETASKQGVGGSVDDDSDTAGSTEQSVHEDNCAKDFDREDAVRRTSGDSDMIQLAVRNYLEQVNSRVDELERRLSEDDLEAAGRIAHNMAGASANVSATALRVCMLAIERFCTLGERLAAQKELARIPELLKRFRRSVTGHGFGLSG